MYSIRLFIIKFRKLDPKKDSSEIIIDGDRLNPRISIPVNRELIDNGDDCGDVEIKIVPIFFNIGINEKQSMADAMTRKPNEKVSLIGTY